MRRVARLVGGAFRPCLRADDPSQPSSDYQFASGGGRVGFIDSVSQPFRAGCDRLRLTADGKLRNCLFECDEWDVGEVLRKEPFDSRALQAPLCAGTLAKMRTVSTRPIFGPRAGDVSDRRLTGMNEPFDALQRRVYLTMRLPSWPKSSAAIEAAQKFIHECGATSGRGSLSRLPCWQIDGSPMHDTTWLNSPGHRTGRSEHRLCSSGTARISNAALWGLLRPGDHVITSAAEHNSLLRPLKQLETHHAVRLSTSSAMRMVFPISSGGRARFTTRVGSLSVTLPTSQAASKPSTVGDLALRASSKLLVDVLKRWATSPSMFRPAVLMYRPPPDISNARLGGDWIVDERARAAIATATIDVRRHSASGK
ncbi:MAG: hypothetical protein R3C56_17715 [Pirellulaceae bacterium]